MSRVATIFNVYILYKDAYIQENKEITELSQAFLLVFKKV